MTGRMSDERALRLHERTMPVQRAKAKISQVFWEQVGAHELTYGEIAGLLSDLLATAAKYMVRDERHPDDPERKGDEA